MLIASCYKCCRIAAIIQCIGSGTRCENLRRSIVALVSQFALDSIPFHSILILLAEHISVLLLP